MKKIPTVFVRDPDDMRYVTDEVHPACQWVLDGEGVATRKYDGTCVMLDEDGRWWARREVKWGKQPPPNFIEVDHDEATGKCVGWEPIEQSGFAKFHAEALGNPHERRAEGTYELVGPKINGNPEARDEHDLEPHDLAERYPALNNPQGYEELRRALTALPWEGIVWHHPDRRMAKLKGRDFPSPAPCEPGDEREGGGR